MSQRSIRELKKQKVKVVNMTDAERAAWRNYQQRVKATKELFEGAGLALGVLTLFVGAILIGPLIMYGAWNLGLVNAAEAMGREVDTINFWTAFGLSLLLSIVRGLSRAAQGKPAIEIKGKA